MKDYDEFQINLTLKFRIPKEGITINSVLYTVAKNLGQIGIAISKALLGGIEEKAIKEKLENEPGYARNGHQSSGRQIRASFGSFSYRPAQLYNPEEKKTLIPLKEKLQWPSYRRQMDESIQGSVGLLSHLSYRQSVKESKRMLGTEQSATTFHRMFNLFSEKYFAWPNQKDVPYKFLMADGTKVRLQDGRGRSLGKGEMQWAMASTGEGKSFKPIGFWINESWEDIKREIEGRLDYTKLEVLFADGDREIQALLGEGMRLQRCVLHGEREFFHKLYLDGFKKKRQAPLKRQIGAIPIFQVNQAMMEKLEEKDKEKVGDLVNKSREGLEDILRILDPNKYSYTHAYIKNLKDNLFTFFDYWLEKKEWIPLTTNAIESAFSRVKNRLWSIGKRWTERGLLNWLKVMIQKIFNPDMWQRFWDEYLALNPAFQLVALEVSYKWV